MIYYLLLRAGKRTLDFIIVRNLTAQNLHGNHAESRNLLFSLRVTSVVTNRRIVNSESGTDLYYAIREIHTLHLHIISSPVDALL